MTFYYEVLYIFIPFIIGDLGRDWFRSGSVDRIWFFAFTTIMAFCITLDPVFAAIWLLYLLAYVVPPANAVYSTLTGKAPDRPDSIMWRWIQVISLRLTNITEYPSSIIYWKNFGVIAGELRALPVVFPIIAMILYTHSWMPIVGCGVCMHGWFYRKLDAVKGDKAIFYITGVFMMLGAWGL